MRLPPKVMAFLRSRRLRLTLAWSPFVACIVLGVVYAAINAYGRWKFDKTVDALVARGFHRTEAEAIGPMPPDGENLLRHPVVLEELELGKGDVSDDSDADPFDDVPDPKEPGEKQLTWLSEMEGLEEKAEEITDGKPWLLSEHLNGPEGRKSAVELMRLLAPYESRRRAMMKAIASGRPACASYQMHDDSDELLHVLLEASRFVIDRGQVALAAGRKDEAREDFVTALSNTKGFQTTAISQWHAEAAISQMTDLVHNAFMTAPDGSWSDEELREFDSELQGLGEGRLMMRFQRLHVAWVIEVRNKLQKGTIVPPKRIDWEEWRATWEWNRESAVQHARLVWSAVEPRGLDDLALASALSRLADEIDEVGDPPEWQRLLEFLPVAEEFYSDDAVNRLQRFHGIAETLAWEMSIGPYTPRDFSADIYNDDRAYGEGRCAEGYIWIAMARGAIALERHRLRHGSYPASLEGIDPDMGKDLPVDPFSRKPFVYRVREDGGFEMESASPSWRKEGPFVWRREAGP